MTDKVCPPLGTGSVDFNALNDAARKGEDLTKALAQATTGGPPKTATAEPAPAPAGAPPAADRKAAAKSEAPATRGES